MTSPLLPPPETVRVLCWTWERQPPFRDRYDAMVRHGQDLVSVVERREIRARAVLP